MESNLIFKDHKEKIKESELETHYGHKGRVFQDKEAAQNFRKKCGKKSVITKLIEYNDKDIHYVEDRIGRHKEGATPIFKGYLVTIKD